MERQVEHPLIELQAVDKTYKIEQQSITALRCIELKIPAASQIAITGKSGAGKSTLLHVIGTLDRPSQGEVRIKGVNTSAMNDQAVSAFRNQTIGFVFQMNNLLPEFTALENVMMPGLIAGAGRAQVESRARTLLGAVGLAQRAAHRPGELSGGEQQRVAIARALVMAPPILLADEPTGNLDLKTANAVEELLLGLCREHRVTMLLVTHDPDLAARLPRQVVMEDGRIIQAEGLI